MKLTGKHINIIIRSLKITVWMLIFAFFPAYASAAEAVEKSEQSAIEKDIKRESLFPEKRLSLGESHFTWGAEVGASIDMDGNDLSTFDLDALLGYKNPSIRIAGVGVGIHRALGSGNMFIPVYGVIRTSFTSRPSPLFLHFRAGYSFNTFADSPTFGDTSAAIGLGVNLAMSRRFKSHIILSYVYRHFSHRNQETAGIRINNSNLAQISFGVNF